MRATGLFSLFFWGDVMGQGGGAAASSADVHRTARSAAASPCTSLLKKESSPVRLCSKDSVPDQVEHREMAPRK